MVTQRFAGLMLNYRDADRSIRCIQSLLDEGMVHVLVWDNSADDGASAHQLSAIFAGDPRVRVHVSHENLGFARGVNAGLQACIRHFQAQVVLVINNDALLMAGALATLARASAAHPQAAVISMDIDHAGRRQGPMFYQRWSGLQCRRRRAGTFPYASGCCLWVDVARAPRPLLDEAFFMYGEDCELAWRLLQQPGQWLHLPDMLVTHEGSASSGMGSAFYETHMVAAHLLLARKLANGRLQAIWFSLARVPVLAVRAMLRSVRYRSLRPWRALRDGAMLAWRQPAA